MKQCCANCDNSKLLGGYWFKEYACLWKPEGNVPVWWAKKKTNWRAPSAGRTCKCWQEKK